MTAYTGALTRSAHFAFRPPVPGISSAHEHAPGSADPFQPDPEGAPPPSQPGDIWQPRDPASYTEMQVADRPHWAALEAPVPSNVHEAVADQAATERMLANHGFVAYRPDTYPVYRHATQGKSIDYVDGRRPVTLSMEALQAGKNSYDFTNAPSEVYGGDRYRVGTEIEMFGRYEFWTKQGQDANLRGYTGLAPALPVDKPRLADYAPYTPNSAGTDTWTLNQWQAPSMFSLPSETASTDYQAATQSPAPGADFTDSGGERL